MEILLFFIALLLYLIYRKISDYLSKRDETVVTTDEMPQWQQNLFHYLREINWKLGAVSDYYLSKTPAGPGSYNFEKKEALIRVYRDYLIKTEKISKKEAEIRAPFEFYEIYKYEIDDLIDKLNGGTFDWKGWGKDNEKKAEDNYYKSGILDKDIDKLVNPKDNSDQIIPHDLFAPLYSLIVKREYEQGTKLEIDTVDEIDTAKDYSAFVKNRAIITKLETLGIVKRINSDNWGRNPKFVLLIYDLDELRDMIYGKGNASHDNEFFEERWNEGKLQNLFRRSLWDN